MDVKEILIKIGYAILFCLSLFLVIDGQLKVGHIGLLKMLLGLSGILVLLGVYNHSKK
jgi:hypothetical protein